MKVVAVLAAVVAVAVATPSAWTLGDLSDAIHNPTTRAELKPMLERALDIFMEGVFHGTQKGPVTISTSEGVGGTFTLPQLDAALSNAAISSSMFKPYLEEALNEMMSALFAGHAMETIEVRVPAFQLSYWSLQEIDAALTDAPKPAMIPYLANALDALMEDLIHGGKESSIVVAMPLDVVAAPESAVSVNPAVSGITAPATVVSGAGNPLVEIIVNIQRNDVASSIVDGPSPAPATSPEAPVSPVDVIAVLPIDPSPEVSVSPVDVIGVLPTVPQPHPIDVIAIHPIEVVPAPVNPVDVAGVLPVEALPPNPAAAVGPMV